MAFSTQPATTLLLRNTRNANTLTVKTDNLKLEVESVASFDILLDQQASLLEDQKEQAT